MSDETWVAISGTDGYFVSNLGRVRSSRTILKHFGVGKIGNKYPAVHVSPRGTTKVHILVAEAFIGPRPDGMQINHINGDKADASVSNLEYVTPSENAAHSYRIGLQKPRIGEQSATAKLTADDVRAIRASDESGVAVAARYGVTGTQISNIRLGRQWKHV